MSTDTIWLAVTATVRLACVYRTTRERAAVDASCAFAGVSALSKRRRAHYAGRRYGARRAACTATERRACSHKSSEAAPLISTRSRFFA
eukprot:6197950-Pleurochrysis_carterae.AAC.3